MHGDGRDAELLRRAENAQSDLAAVGDQDFLEHQAVLPCATRRGGRPPKGVEGISAGPRSVTSRRRDRSGDTRRGADARFPMLRMVPPPPHGGGYGDGPHHSITNSAWPYSTGWPSATRIWVTVPPLGAMISLKVFIASTRRILSPALTSGADVDERRRFGRRPQVGGADHRRLHRSRDVPPSPRAPARRRARLPEALRAPARACHRHHASRWSSSGGRRGSSARPSGTRSPRDRGVWQYPRGSRRARSGRRSRRIFLALIGRDRLRRAVTGVSARFLIDQRAQRELVGQRAEAE